MPRLNAFSVLVALTLVACQTNQEAPKAAEPKVLAPTPPSVSCAVDSQCDKFLRCLDGVCAVPPAITGAVRADTPIATFYNGDKEVGQFFLEVADDPEEQRRGLMYRTEMRDNWGMIFVYDTDEIHQFWMKNTLIPLDMLFIGADGVVRGIVSDVPPLTLTGRGISEASRHVLELNAGTCARLGSRQGRACGLRTRPTFP
ncbi:MAG: DUF192 domain-containing protein [bacterium]